MKLKKAAYVTVCLLLALVITAGCAAGDKNPVNTGSPPTAEVNNGKKIPENTTISQTPPKGTDNGAVAGKNAAAKISYEDVYAAIEELNRGTDYRFAKGEFDLVEESGAVPMPSSAPTSGAMADKPANDMDMGNSAGGGGYSETNVQVEGVDEGDIVKTDGEYIYVLRPYIDGRSELAIFKADGENTSRVAALTVCKTNSDFTPYNEKDGYSSVNESAYEMYVTGGTLAVVTNYNSYSETLTNGMYKYENIQTEKVYIYDITNRASPVLRATLGQDGYHIASRLIGDKLYLVSSYYVYDYEQSRPETYIPRIYTGDSSALVASDCIVISPDFSSTKYTVICSYDLSAATLVDVKTTLGGGDIVYMNGNSLYIAGAASAQSESEPREESVYKVVKYTTQSVTDITKYDISGGAISLAASGRVPGYLNNQFSLDEYAGHLRVVTTTRVQAWTAYTDEQFGWTNYDWENSATHNALFVLDGSLDIAGSIENLAENETVQSVRFFGDVGYFVTFERVDPLFAVDLSNPTSPIILSELKIPGFSQYMHGFSDGRLFGLGMDADPETGRTTTMKLSMFDTSDLKNVTEKHTFLLDSYYSNALYNHKAILISSEKDIIAFPSDSGYDIYGYSDNSGFYKRASVTGLDWYGDSRGLYIGDCIYVVMSDRLAILELDSFTILKNLSY